MKTLITASTAALAIAASGAFAQTFAENVIADLQANGFHSIEVKQGPSQLKAEGVRDNEKIEVVYDLSTGAILKQEIETVVSGGAGQSTVEFATKDDDFVDVGGDDENDDEEDDESDDSESSDDESNDDENDDSEDDESDDSEDDESDESDESEDDSEDDES